MRLQTTHTGSLPRPADLAAMLVRRDQGEIVPGLDERIRGAVAEVVKHQADLGVDVLNDGEMGKVGYAHYIKDRLTGFDGESEWVSSNRPELDDFPDFAARWQAERQSAMVAATTPACTGEVRVKNREAVLADIATLKAAAADAGLAGDRLFMSAASPGVIAHFFANHHYPTREAFLAALADAMRAEYEAIAEAGILLQIDCPDLAMSRSSVFADITLEEFRKHMELNIEALNHAVARIPADRMRFHICWGNSEAPHTRDVPLIDIADVLLRAKPAGLVLEAANPRHGHEWRVWEDIKLPDDRYIVAGMIDSTNNYVEHPDLVAQRFMNYARVVGPERVLGGSDCGFGTTATMVQVAPTITWAKLRSLAEGAAIASRELGL